MKAVDAKQLAAMRAGSAGVFTDTCEIVRPGTPTWNGGVVVPGTPTKTTESCEFSEVSGYEASEDMIAVRGSYRMKLRWAADVKATDRVQYKSVVYNVVWAPSPTGLGATRIVGLVDAPGVAVV